MASRQTAHEWFGRALLKAKNLQAYADGPHSKLKLHAPD